MISYIKTLNSYAKNKNVLQKNKAFKDKFLGMSCYIIGNGPSFNENDAKKLHGKICFTVNSMTESRLFDIINPSFHVMVDSTRFSEEYPEFIKNLWKLSEKDTKPTYIFPIKAKNFCEEKGLNKVLNISYIMQESKLTDKITNIDLAGIIPQYQNVINVAIYAAIYMGFTNIYLTGCDMTGFIHEFTEDGEVNYGGHFYDKEINSEKSVMDKLQLTRTNEFMLTAYANVFRLFKLTNDFAEKKGIKIWNASRKSTIDTFPFIKFEDALSR